MIVTQSFMTAVAALLAVLTFTHRESLWLLYAMTACSSGAGAFDAPARQSLIPRLVPDEDLPGALSQFRRLSGGNDRGARAGGTG